MSHFTRRIELLANFAIIVLAVMIVGVFVRNHFFSQQSRTMVEQVQLGRKVSLPDVDWAKNGQTLLLVLQKGCHFCTENAPFYQRLTHWADESHKVQLIAVLPQDTDTGRQYLDALGVPVQEIRQAAPSTLGVKGTPTLILVNNAGEVTGAWVGKLPADTETEVLARLRGKD